MAGRTRAATARAAANPPPSPFPATKSGRRGAASSRRPQLVSRDSPTVTSESAPSRRGGTKCGKRRSGESPSTRSSPPVVVDIDEDSSADLCRCRTTLLHDIVDTEYIEFVHDLQKNELLDKITELQNVTARLDAVIHKVAQDLVNIEANVEDKDARMQTIENYAASIHRNVKRMHAKVNKLVCSQN